MKSFKIPCSSALFISKQNPSTNFNSSHHITVGQYENDEFRGLIEFNLNPRIFDFKIYRADLVIYLDETKIDLNIEALMLNISRNFDKFNPNNLTWETAPRFFQEAHFSKVEPNYTKNYIMLDITKILEYWIKNRVSIFGLTLLGLTQSSLIYLSNTINKKPFLEIFLSEEDPCDSYNYANQHIHKPKLFNESALVNPSIAHCNSTPPNNHSCNTSNSSFSFDKTHHNQNLCYDELVNPPNTNSLTCSSSTFDRIACGTFISTNGELLNANHATYVKFDIENNTIRTNLTIKNDGIFILTKGLYKIDYFINCRSEPFSTVELELDGIPISFSRIQISSSDAPTSSSTIIDVLEDNMILRLKISSSNSILINTGICASLTIVKIN